MKILIATGIFPPDIGGAAYYAENLAKEFVCRNNDVKIVTYRLEKKLPIGFRHCFYFFKLILRIPWVDLIVALDTFSVGLPAVIAAKIFKKKITIRVSGDFLWESYVERSGNLIPIRHFYEKMPKLSQKEKLIFWFTKFVLKNCSALVFTTAWQRDIFGKPYALDSSKNRIIENFYEEKIADLGFQEKNFLWAGRPLNLKNLKVLKAAFSEAQKENGSIKLEISEKVSQEDLFKKIQTCYAVILPSISDVSPNFAIDAIRAGKPFILTRETGLYERLKDVGIFIDPLDKDDIKKKILFLTVDNNYNEYKKRIGVFNFTHSWRQIADEFLDIYADLHLGK